MKVLVAYDGSLDAKAALRYGIGKAREYRGELIALHVFPGHLFIDYDAGPLAEKHARREAEDHLETARTLIRATGGGIKAGVALAEGRALDEVLRCARDEDVDLIVAPPALEALIDKACCLTDIVSTEEPPAEEQTETGAIAELGIWRLP